MYKPLNARLFDLWQTARSAKIDIRMMRRICSDLWLNLQQSSDLHRELKRMLPLRRISTLVVVWRRESLLLTGSG